MSPRRAVIGAGARVVGRVAGDEDLLLLGRVEGELDLSGKLEIEVGGVARAKICAAAVRVAGTVVGDILARDLLVLEPSARVIGDLRAARLVIEPGAQLMGAVAVEEAPPGAPRSRFEARRLRDSWAAGAPPARVTLEPEPEPPPSRWTVPSRPSQEVEGVIEPSRRRVTVRVRPREER